MSDDDCLAFFDPSLSEKERAGAIAAELRRGHPSARFCRLLAAMIDEHSAHEVSLPWHSKNVTRFKFVLLHKGRGQPTKVVNVELGKAMLAATNGVKRTDAKRVKDGIARRFGVKLGEAEAAMKTQRRDDEARERREHLERQGLQEGKEFDE